MKDFDLGRVLGKGRFATVYLAREKLKGFIVVLKVIYKSVLAKYQAERALRSEIEVQAHLRHPNIVRIFGYFHDADRIYLILEYAMNGDIFNDVQSCRLDEHTAASYTAQVGRALHYMHRNYVIHRDIKLENVYLNESGQIKVGDFGWSVHTHKLKNDKVVGTLHYMAPEMLTPESNLYDHKVDNWALGILLYEMLCSALPFYGETEEDLERKILRGKLKIPPFVSPEAADLMRRLLQKDPRKRMELDELEAHPWVVKQLRVRSLKYLCLKFVRESSKFFEYDLGKLPVKLRLEIQDDTIYRFYYQ
uniref:Aurora kinase n=1 Tax=Arcella intermedia TaxID=1963864 RepID=A0A6B2LB18_9EUKA